MIPKDKIISVLHPNVNKKWWAVNMMIYLSNLLKKENSVEFYTFSYDENLFSDSVTFKVNCLSKLQIAYAIRNSDYIIIWNSPMHFVWVLSKLIFFSKAKLIWWHHHYPWYYGKDTNVYIWIKRLLERASILFIDEVISNSFYLQSSLKDIFGIESKILHPILDRDFTKVAYNEIDFTSKTIFTYGRWVEWKNLNQVFLTYDMLKGQVDWLKLNIWWVGEELDFFKDKYRDDLNVSFLWLLDNMSIIDNLQKSLVCLFTSKIDSFWMTIIEAMSIGVPVVAFDINGSREIIQDWQNWFLVNSDSEFTRKVLDILSDSELHKNLSINCLDIKLRFSEANFKKSLKDIFYS